MELEEVSEQMLFVWQSLPFAVCSRVRERKGVGGLYGWRSKVLSRGIGKFMYSKSVVLQMTGDSSRCLLR